MRKPADALGSFRSGYDFGAVGMEAVCHAVQHLGIFATFGLFHQTKGKVGNTAGHGPTNQKIGQNPMRVMAVIFVVFK
jgi:hypothetical protein